MMRWMRWEVRSAKAACAYSVSLCYLDLVRDSTPTNPSHLSFYFDAPFFRVCPDFSFISAYSTVVPCYWPVRVQPI